MLSISRRFSKYIVFLVANFNAYAKNGQTLLSPSVCARSRFAYYYYYYYYYITYIYGRTNGFINIIYVLRPGPSAGKVLRHARLEIYKVSAAAGKVVWPCTAGFFYGDCYPI